jgi:hypothetical protein
LSALAADLEIAVAEMEAEELLWKRHEFTPCTTQQGIPR